MCVFLFVSSGFGRITFDFDFVSFKVVSIVDFKGSNDGTIYGATIDTDLYGGDTPKIPRAVDNAPTARADTIGNGSASFTASNTDYIATSATFQTTLDGAFTVTAWI